MTVLVEVFGASGLTVSETKTETMILPIPHTGISIYLGGMIMGNPVLPAEIGCRIRAGWVNFNLDGEVRGG